MTRCWLCKKYSFVAFAKTKVDGHTTYLEVCLDCAEGVGMDRDQFMKFYNSYKKASSVKEKLNVRELMKNARHKVNNGPFCECGENLKKAGSFLICWRCFSQEDV